MQEVEQRPVKKRRFFVEDSDVDDHHRRPSPSAVLPNESDAPANTARSVVASKDHGDSGNRLNGCNGQSSGAGAGAGAGAGDGDGDGDGDNSEKLDPESFRAVIGDDVSDEVVERIREMSGDNLTRG